MKSLNNELIVQRGETFAMSKTVVNKNGTPFVIPSGLQNPYIRVTVSTTEYDQTQRYVKNYWLDAGVFDRFDSSVPFDLSKLSDDPDTFDQKYFSFDEITPEASRNSATYQGTEEGYSYYSYQTVSPAHQVDIISYSDGRFAAAVDGLAIIVHKMQQTFEIDDTTYECDYYIVLDGNKYWLLSPADQTCYLFTQLLARGYIGDTMVYCQPGDGLFYFSTNEELGYKHFKDGWTDYKFNFSVLFPNTETRNWVAQSYVYEISLCSGLKTLDYLRNIAASVGIQYGGDVSSELYRMLVDFGYEFSEEFVLDRPIQIDYVRPLLNPTKMSVLNNISN